MKEIRVKLTRKQAEGIYGAYDWLIGAYTYATEHEFLLHAHIVAMYWRLEAMLPGEWKSKTMKLNEVECVAFCQVWSKWNTLEAGERGQVYVRGLLDIIQKNGIQQNFKNNG